MKIAVVADVHLHDLYGGYGMVEEGSSGLALRTLADTMASTRVFNESYPAFIAVLDDIVQRGIRDVVLPGDYSDDGQLGAVTALKRVLSLYEERHGLRFFLTFGNHDCYGPQPRHQAKWLTGADGLERVLVTSDETALEPALCCPGMRGMSALEALEAMASYGVARPEGVLHWETPFGEGAGFDHRRPAGNETSGLDASYLVEPQEGLWLLMLDANVFQKADHGWILKADAAWDHVLAARPYLLEWIGDVTRRADQLGKTLLAFSHYPVLPLTLAGEGDAMRATGTPDWLMRMPSLETGRQLAAAGMRWHFSGHMHVAGRIELDALVNIAVPSPVAYPAGYVVIEIQDRSVKVETIGLKDAPGFNVAFPAYENQVCRGEDFDRHPILRTTYIDFLRAHLLQLVVNRHAPNDWSPDLVACLDRPIEHVLRSDSRMTKVIETWRDVVSHPFLIMMEDYYLLRASDGSWLDSIEPDRFAFYCDLHEVMVVDGSADDRSCCHDFLLAFLGAFRKFWHSPSC